MATITAFVNRELNGATLADFSAKSGNCYWENYAALTDIAEHQTRNDMAEILEKKGDFEIDFNKEWTVYSNSSV